MVLGDWIVEKCVHPHFAIHCHNNRLSYRRITSTTGVALVEVEGTLEHQACLPQSTSTSHCSYKHQVYRVVPRRHSRHPECSTIHEILDVRRELE